MKRLMLMSCAVMALAACTQKPKSVAPVAVASAESNSISTQATDNKKPDLTKNVLTCTYPVAQTDSKSSIMARFGKEAEIADIAGPEGTTLKGIVLFGKDPARRIEVILNDEDNNRIDGVSLGGEAKAWSAADLHLGDSITKVTAKNGKPFDLGGFGWDYGGYATDYKGGALDHFEKGCLISMRFDVTGDHVSDDTQGERTLISNDPKVLAAKAYITEISLSWAPEGQ